MDRTPSTQGIWWVESPARGVQESACRPNGREVGSGAWWERLGGSTLIARTEKEEEAIPHLPQGARGLHYAGHLHTYSWYFSTVRGRLLESMLAASQKISKGNRWSAGSLPLSHMPCLQQIRICKLHVPPTTTRARGAPPPKWPLSTHPPASDTSCTGVGRAG